MKIKLLHCGDFHLDAPFTSLSDMDGRPEQRRQELRQVLGRTIELAIEEKVDVLLVCGDLYEHGYIRKSTFNFIYNQFEKITGIPVLIIPGNHDPAVQDSLYCSTVWPQNVHILTGTNSFYDHLPTNTRIYGSIPDVEKPDSRRINILMLHGTLDMPFSTDAYQPVSSNLLEEIGFDYCAMGHFHSRIEGAGRQKRIFNPGSPEPLGFDEEGDHGVFIITVDKYQGMESVISPSFRKINLRLYKNLYVQAGCSLTDEQAAEKAALSIEEAGSREDLYRIILQGYISHEIRLDTGNIAALLKDRAFYIRIINDTVPDYDFDQIAKEPGIRGLFVKKMLERAAAAKESERDLVMRALYFGMEAIDEGSVCI